jgi:hypothetical protein
MNRGAKRATGAFFVKIEALPPSQEGTKQTMSTPTYIPHPSFPWNETVAVQRLWKQAHDARFEKGHSEPSTEERAFEAKFKEIMDNYTEASKASKKSLNELRAHYLEKEREQQEKFCAWLAEAEAVGFAPAGEARDAIHCDKCAKAQASFMSTLGATDGPIWR